MTKGVKICIAVIAVIFVASVIASLVLFRKPESEYVAIVQDNEIIYKFDLKSAENQEIRIDCEDGGYNIVEITDGQIRISEADCPDKTCVNTGFLSGSVPVVCLPHKLVIRYSNENETTY